MNMKFYKTVLCIAFVLSLVLINTGCRNKSSEDIITIPGLPRPIANEPALITSAGQSTDTYIIKDMANQLMIHNFFMPQTKEADIEDINTLVFVVGYSPIGEKLHDINFEDEKKRIVKLLKKAEKNNLSVITIFAGGKQRRGAEADELLKLVAPYTNYLIAIQEANYDNMLSNQAKENNIPLTLVKEVRDISEPFASAFR